MLHAKFQIIYSRFWGRSLVKFFTIYGDGGHLGHVTMTIYSNFRSPFQGILYMNKNIIMSSFKSSRDIQKKEGGPDSCFGSLTLNGQVVS